MRRWGVGVVAGWLWLWAAPAAAAPCDTTGPDLVVDGITCQLGGVHSFTNVQVINAGVIEVVTYDGADPVNTGNLELRAASIFVEAGSTITAKGRGYQTVRCGNGGGPVAGAGGVGGCAVRDSGGGGAHFGAGGRGTKDCFVVPPAGSCQFPDEFSEDCGNSLNGGGTACTDTSDCRDFDGLPSVAGVSYFHSIYEIEFGAAGGDKGCRDGDGFSTQPNVAGPGGGRIVLAAPAGNVTVDGTLDTNGRRGCGTGNDSAGGGAGGTILVAAQTVDVGPGAIVTARGGLGGDTQGLAGDPTGECVAPAQQGGTCDDCGGGGGGGIISILSVTSNIDYTAIFDVDGALGGTCPICQGEAGGGAGELQIDGAYIGELCDGFDNDFDDAVDEGLPLLACGMPSCAGGVPQACPPDAPTCIGPVTDTRARFVVVVDTSGSMLTDLAGTPTLGDGSVGHAGADLDGDGAANDSKLFQAKQALSTVIAAYPEIDFSLARYHQDQSVDRSCQLSHWFECHGICCSYDDPRDNVAPAASPACSLDLGAAGVVPVNMVSTAGDECINYAGNCGPPERGADVLVGFGSDINQYLMWLDHQETNFVNDTTEGDYCDFAGGGDCELRGTGPTPLAGSLEAAQAFLTPEIACDGAAACRTYAVIMLTDGAESCQGDPIGAAGSLFASLGVETFVVGFSVLAAEQAELDAIAMAGSGGARGAFFAGDESELVNALAAIVGGSIIFETCNGLDDDCDTLIDEDFPDLGDPCDDGDLGACLGVGTRQCNAAGDGTECVITDPGASPEMEVCDGADNDCDGLIDEGLSCLPMCTPTGPEVCDGVDNDCDGAIDEDDPAIGTPCGITDVGPCEFGMNLCIGGMIVCVGAIDPGVEICNGIDDDCDGEADDLAMCPGETSCVEGGCRIPCAGGEFDCPPGLTCVDEPGVGRVCVPDPCVVCEPHEACILDECVDLCEDVMCEVNETCVQGNCFDCHVLGCDDGQICLSGECIADPCDGVECASDESCVLGECVRDCDDGACPEGQTCNTSGECVDDPCAGVECPQQGDVCIDGECVDDPCNPVACDTGQVCAGGMCVTDPCPGVECSAGRTCVVRPNGEPQCVGDDVEVERVFVAGTGCDCRVGDAGSGSPWAVALALAVLVALRRRRR